MYISCIASNQSDCFIAGTIFYYCWTANCKEWSRMILSVLWRFWKSFLWSHERLLLFSFQLSFPSVLSNTRCSIFQNIFSCIINPLLTKLAILVYWLLVSNLWTSGTLPPVYSRLKSKKIYGYTLFKELQFVWQYHIWQLRSQMSSVISELV